MSDVKQYICPNCGADLKFSPEKQKFTCEFCKGEFTQSEIEKIEKNNSGGNSQNSEEPEEDFSSQTKVYECPSCGAEIISDENTAATICYYCHNPVILKGRVEGKFHPSKVIPFKLSKDKAIETFNTWLGKKWILPKSFLSEKTTEKMTGLYVPFWIADADTRTQFNATGVNKRVWVEGDYEYTETKYYALNRNFSVHYDGVPADGSKKIEDSIMEAIEPYDYSQAVDFNMSYLSGFFADKYDVAKENLWGRISQRMRSNNFQVGRSSCNGYEMVEGARENTNFSNIHWHYLLMPVWFMTYKYKDKIYEYAINGQSGKVTGKLPLSKGKLAILLTIITILGMILGILVWRFWQ